MACLGCLPQPAKSAFVFYVQKNFLSENPFLILGLQVSVIIWSQIGNWSRYLVLNLFQMYWYTQKAFYFFLFSCVRYLQKVLFFFHFLGWYFLYLSLEHFSACSVSVILLKSTTALQGSLYCSGPPDMLQSEMKNLAPGTIHLVPNFFQC